MGLERINISKSVARFTRPMRRLFNRKALARLTRIPRTLLTGGGVAERLVELENRIDRLQRGWNQHLPSLLDSMSDALDAARHAEDGHRRVDAVREDLDRLSSRFELHLIERNFYRQDRSADHGGFVGVMLVMADDRGAIFSQKARELPVIPRSIRTIKVHERFEIAQQNEALNKALAEWFELLIPGGRLEIERSRAVEVIEMSDPQAIDGEDSSRAIFRDGAFSAKFPTDDELIQALRRCGFEMEDGAHGERAVRILASVRPTGDCR